MTMLEHSRPDRPSAGLKAVAVLAVALLAGAVALIRSTPTAPTDVLAASVDASGGSGGSSGSSGSAGDGGRPEDEAPVGPGDLPHAGLVPERTPAQREAIEAVATGSDDRADGPPADAFGPDPEDCRLRNRLLARDLLPVTFRTGGGPGACRVARGALDDPYLGRSIAYTDARAERVGIDRIVSVGYAWQHGAADWSPARRRAFARDPRNLLVADSRQIEAKAGRGPGAWLPPNVALRCAYAARFADLAHEYGLRVSIADQEIARRQCAEA